MLNFYEMRKNESVAPLGLLGLLKFSKIVKRNSLSTSNILKSTHTHFITCTLSLYNWKFYNFDRKNWPGILLRGTRYTWKTFETLLGRQGVNTLYMRKHEKKCANKIAEHKMIVDNCVN